jgi:hypothetical protein
MIDPLAVALGEQPSPEASADGYLVWDSSILFWNSRAKHRLRQAGIEVQGGMTYRTLDLMREWAARCLAQYKPSSCLLSLPSYARVPDLSSPNACLLDHCVFPSMRAAGVCLLIRILPDPMDPGTWETEKPRASGDAATLLRDVTGLLGFDRVKLESQPDQTTP